MLKLFDSEIRVMDVLWQNGDASAKMIADILGDQVGWSKTTTYTVIEKCIKKKAIKRTDPGYICSPLITRQDVQTHETDELIDKLFSGSADLLVANLIEKKRLDAHEIAKLRRMIDELSGEPK